jgi:phosphopantetheinyl transferase (holo-ACP synthase)
VLPWILLKLNCRKLIGNDIVDLLAAGFESNWQRKGFLQKVFSNEEQLLILSHSNPNEMVWLLWSMKEAAYKIYSSTTGIRNFAPAQLCCAEIRKSLTHCTGQVSIAGFSYFTESSIHENMIHTIAASNLAELSATKVEISIPEDWQNLNYKQTRPQCVSHHGAYLALVYL